MILDKLLQFDSGFSIAIAAGTNPSANVVDIGVGLQLTTNPTGLAIPGLAAGAGARDLGIGDDPAMKILVELIAAATSAGTTTIQIQVQGTPDDGTGQPNAATWATYAQSDVIALVTATVVQPAGLQGTHLFDIDWPRPKPGVALPRYWRLQYITTGTGTGGTIASYVVLDRVDQIVSSAGFLSGYVPGITIPN
jgi:hypothetical protein